jgi:hypothetical protein
MSRFQDVKKAFAAARKKYDGYYSQCAYFAGAFSRALIDRFEWPRELVSYERPGYGPVSRIEDALVLEGDTYWHLAMTLRLQEEASPAEDLHLSMRFKRAGDRYIVELFPGVEFDVQEPTAEAFEPVLDLLFEELTLHYDRGLDLFLENRAGKLRIPFSPPEPKPPRPAKAGGEPTK